MALTPRPKTTLNSAADGPSRLTAIVYEPWAPAMKISEVDSSAVGVVDVMLSWEGANDPPEDPRFLVPDDPTACSCTSRNADGCASSVTVIALNEVDCSTALVISSETTTLLQQPVVACLAFITMRKSGSKMP